MRPPIATVFQQVLDPTAPVRISAYDGSSTGPPDAPVWFEIGSPLAVSYLLSAPGELGLARAYVTGELRIHGELYVALRALAEPPEHLGVRAGVRLLRDLGLSYLRRVPLPEQESPGRARRVIDGLRHSKARDSRAISHHYDVSNEFYELVLGPSMTYTCACYPVEDATLEQAQANKHDLVCRKLGLQPGMRLLDVGCGWGGMVIHAARNYDVQALGVTLSREQARWAQKRIAAEGLADQVEVRHLDYRDVTETGFDAVSSIGLTEHVGARNLPSYFRFLASKLRPQGRLLNHSITRTSTREPHGVGPFFDRYVFPDGELEAVSEIAAAMQDNGFEIRHEENLREHYARTTAAWCANLDANWEQAVDLAGLPRARVWALYLAASRLGFERHQIELHQILGVKLDASSTAAMPLRPDW